ncbi:MAG: HDOD domain-containing protein [Nitrosomonas sp.]|nr:MAG: HDOD domain-containing protein [Nitrosomonas sp.]
MEKNAILGVLAEEVERGRLIFPTSINNAMCTRQKLEDPDCNQDTVIRIIQAEPLLSAKIVAIANSAVFNRSNRKITDVRTAVTLIGLRTVRNLATVIIVQQLAGSQIKADLVAQLWKHSAHVAALAQVIARRITAQDPETAMFAGMIHEISWFYLLAREKYYPGLIDESMADSWNSNDDPDDDSEPDSEITIGTAILHALSVPEAVLKNIVHLWKGYLSFPPTCLGDTLLIANQLAPVKSPFTIPAGYPHHAMHANIDFFIDEATLSDILKDSEDEVLSLTTALCG